MLNFLLTAVAFIFSTATFTFSYSYSGVARTFTAYGKAIPEVCVVKENASGNLLITPYFNINNLKKMTDQYFSANLQRYLGKDQTYTLTYAFYRESNGRYTITNTTPSRVSIYLRCPISWFGSYKNTATFDIKKGAFYE